MEVKLYLYNEKLFKVSIEGREKKIRKKEKINTKS